MIIIQPRFANSDDPRLGKLCLNPLQVAFCSIRVDPGSSPNVIVRVCEGFHPGITLFVDADA